MTRAYRIGAAAARSGLSDAVIHVWERRYGVPTPARTPGGYRVFSEQDIAVLRRLRELTEDGMAIREAAALAPRLRREIAAGRGAADGAQLTRWRQAILAAAGRLDQEGVARVLDAALAALPPLALYDEFIVRLEREMWARASRGPAGRSQQRLLSQVLRSRLLDMLRGAVRGRTRGRVVCACLPDEEHDLGLLGAALRFRAAAFRVTFLGARTPVEHLAHVARRLRARVVALACVSDPGPTVLRRTLGAVRRALPGTRCINRRAGRRPARGGVRARRRDGGRRRRRVAPVTGLRDRTAPARRRQVSSRPPVPTNRSSGSAKSTLNVVRLP